MIQRNNHAGHGGGEGGTARKGVNALAGHSLSLGRQSQQTASTAAAAPRPEPESKRIEQLSCHFEQGRGRLAGGWGEGMLGGAGAVGVDTYALLHLNYVKSILF